ncbi:hypothetical protein AB0N17_35195 [Streptomyces sp. NPDC051133]|uniref:hypothetical protein n=1 Tax=Streptomyces sp. NPDC051133 TaxID=3155521 RepID=UPI003445B79D
MATSRAEASGPRFCTLLENTTSPSTRSRHRSTPTADVGRTPTSSPAGNNGPSTERPTSTPHTSAGTA